MLEKILLYNVKNPQHIIKAASNMRIISGFINESDTDRTLAEIADDVRGISLSDAEGYQPQENKESLIVFCDVTDKHMDKLLFEMRQKSFDVSFKAVLTDTWSPPCQNAPAVAPEAPPALCQRKPGRCRLYSGTPAP